MVTFFFFLVSVSLCENSKQTERVIRMKITPLSNNLNGVIKSKYARKIQVKWNYNDVKPWRRIQGLLINMRGKAIPVLKHPSFPFSSPQKEEFLENII